MHKLCRLACAVLLCVVDNDRYYLTVIIPNGDPRVLLVAFDEIKVRLVDGMASSIVVQCVNLTVWLRNATDGGTIAVISVCVLVYVITQMDNIVHRVLHCLEHYCRYRPG